MQALYEAVRKRDPAQSEFLQAVEEVRTLFGKQSGLSTGSRADVVSKSHMRLKFLRPVVRCACFDER
jgi:hypothetical protein